MVEAPWVTSFNVENDCRCGRLSGLTIEKLMAKGTGCQDRYVCPRLDRVRRTHPKLNEYLNRQKKGVA